MPGSPELGAPLAPPHRRRLPSATAALALVVPSARLRAPPRRSWRSAAPSQVPRGLRPPGAHPAATARGEQAWHRRARRQRQSARALLALDAARRRIAAHHGGGGGGARSSSAMPPRQGTADEGDGAEIILRQGLRELLDRVERGTGANSSGGRGRTTGRNDGPQGNGAGGRPNSNKSARNMGHTAAAAGERRPQPGDWTCGSCGFAPNFARRRNCFDCRRPRSPRGDGGVARAGSSGGGLSRGPVNANGLRPILGRGKTSSWGSWWHPQRAPGTHIPRPWCKCGGQSGGGASGRGRASGSRVPPSGVARVRIHG